MIETPNVSLSNFEGPLDLLLYLIQREEIDVYDIPLHEVTSQFLSELNAATGRLDRGAEFLGSTSFLLLLKSERLLPVLEKSEREDENTTLTLLKDLIEYCSFKEMAKRLSLVEEKASGHFLRGKIPEIDLKPPLAPISHTIEDLGKILQKLLATKPKNQPPIKDEGFLVSERIEFLRKCLKESQQVAFQTLFSLEKSKDELIATFLAILQLIKQQEVTSKIIENSLCFYYES